MGFKQEVSPPGDTLRETLDAFKLSEAGLASQCGLDESVINNIIKGQTEITLEIATQLEKVLSVPASFWITRELHYRESKNE